MACRRVARRDAIVGLPQSSHPVPRTRSPICQLASHQVLNIDVAACDEKFWRKLDEVKKPFGPIMSDVMNIKHVPEVRVLACEA